MPSAAGSATGLNRFSKGVYNTLFRRNSVYIGVIFASAFAFEMIYDKAVDRVWDKWNKGKQWKDIKDKYVEA